jgi:3-oxoacyl-[acyl-carrier protein] reductase
MTRAVVPGMIERGHGKVINMSSQLGLRGAANMAGYCATKAGVLGLTRALARELIPFGIHVNAIAPGPVATPMTEGVPQETLDAIYAELPIHRLAKAEEIAPTAVMLATADGAYYVGATLNVSGGHVM